MWQALQQWPARHLDVLPSPAGSKLPEPPVWPADLQVSWICSPDGWLCEVKGLLPGRWRGCYSNSFTGQRTIWKWGEGRGQGLGPGVVDNWKRPWGFGGVKLSNSPGQLCMCVCGGGALLLLVVVVHVRPFPLKPQDNLLAPLQ